MELNETVTISKETYDSMREQITTLSKQVREKTIYKEVYPDWFECLPLYAVILLFAMFVILISKPF